MLIEKANWMMVEEYLKTDDRIVFVLGATEEHGYASLSTDTQCAWEIAKEACARQNVLLAPPLHFGPSPFSLAFPGTVSLRVKTYYNVIRDMIDSVVRVGFKRILFFSGHGGNMRAKEAITEYMLDRSDLTLKFREWYLMPKTYARITELGGTQRDHASWLETFQWINVVAPVPDLFKEQIYFEDTYAQTPDEVRAVSGDGVKGGKYLLPEPIMRDFFELAVGELEDLLKDGWDKFKKVATP